MKEKDPVHWRVPFRLTKQVASKGFGKKATILVDDREEKSNFL